jgi:hypothetical protein
MRGSRPISGHWGVKQELENLQKRWQGEGRFRGLYAGMSLEREGVVLGAKTLLAKRLSDGSLESEDARVLTLLSVAYGNPVELSVVGAIRRASKHARAGDECMASMHIALARLPRLPNLPDAARRLFIADGLMEEGVSPRDIWTALEFDSAPLDALEKFDPNEARLPAGSGRPSGEWTSGKIGSKIMDVIAIADWASLIARIGPAAATFLVATLWSTPAGGRKHQGTVTGRPDLRYSWNGDETELDIQQVSNGKAVMHATLGPDGKFRNRGRAIAQIKGDDVVVDVTALPSDQPKTESADDEPRLCPEPPVPDKPGLVGSTGDRARAYEQFMRLRINPTQPTPSGLTYVLPNLEDNGKIVHFDDCQQEPGTVNDNGTFNVPGSMIEFKGPGYAEKLADKGDWFRTSQEVDLPKQALSQLQAAHGRQVIWYFAEPEALNFARNVFNEKENKNKGLDKIRLEFGLWPGSAEWQ